MRNWNDVVLSMFCLMFKYSSFDKIIKAFNLFRKKTGSDNYFRIHLDKKVLTGAGLGGGSSNAATALWVANQFSGEVATEKELQEWSGNIVSDIPFFFSHGAAYCTGRGEVVEDIPPPLPSDILMILIKPPEACSTAEVYKHLQLDQTSKIDPLTLLEKISRNGISQDVCVNDLGKGDANIHLPERRQRIGWVRRKNSCSRLLPSTLVLRFPRKLYVD